MLWECKDCGTLLAVGLMRCPHCNRNHIYKGEDGKVGKTTAHGKGAEGTNALDPEYREKLGLDKQDEAGPKPSDDAPGAWEQVQQREEENKAPEGVDEPGSDWRDATLAVNEEEGDPSSRGDSSSASKSSKGKPGKKSSSDDPPPVTAPTAGLRSSKTVEAKNTAGSTDTGQKGAKK